MNHANTSNMNYYDNSYVAGENVMLSEDKTSISIINTNFVNNYTLFNSLTGLQAEDWIDGSKGTIVFSGLDPKTEYEVRVQSKDDIQPKPVVNPHFAIIHVLPLVDADIIVPAQTPTFKSADGCGMISIKADSKYGYAILNGNNQPLSNKQLKMWGIKVTDDKGFLLPRTDDGYFFGCKTNMHFDVPAGGEFKMGGKNLEKKYTFINGPTFSTPGIYYNAWYGYVPPYDAGKKGTYNFNIIPACPYTTYTLYDKAGAMQTQKMVKTGSNKVVFKSVSPDNSYITGSPLIL